VWGLERSEATRRDRKLKIVVEKNIFSFKVHSGVISVARLFSLSLGVCYFVK
jgi:hypothetical protein